MKYPDQDVLFIEKEQYIYKIVEEISILAYYNNEHREGLDACEKIRFHPFLTDWHCRNMAMINSRFYLSPLRAKKMVDLSSSLSLPLAPATPTATSTSPGCVLPSFSETPFVSLESMKPFFLNGFFSPPEIQTWKPCNPSIICLSLDELKKLQLPFFKIVCKEHKKTKFQKQSLPEQYYIVNIRCVNYLMDTESEDYKMQGNKICTRNFICLFSAEDDFHQYAGIEVVDMRVKPFPPRTYIFGMEDCKIFLYENELWCSFTSPDHLQTTEINPQLGLVHLQCVEVSDSKTQNQMVNHQKENKVYPFASNANFPKEYLFFAKEVVYLEKPVPSRAEKNWLPLLYQTKESTQKSLFFVYRLYPFQMKEMDLTTGKCIKTIDVTLSSVHDPEKLFTYQDFRGSAGPLEIKRNWGGIHEPGWLVVAHEVCLQSEPKKRQRMYQHRFLWYNKQFQLQKMSVPWCIWGWSIEYCNGMALHFKNKSDKTLVLSVGKFDAEAFLVFLDLSYVFSLLLDFNPSSLKNQWQPFYI